MMLPATDEIPLLGTDELERLQALVLERRDKRRSVTSPWHGPATSRHRGYGMELHDVRPYQPGDDIRHMDWRATARSNKPTTKIFLEERQHNLFLLIDRRPPMRFGTRGEIKAASAARAAGILAFTAMAANEQVGGIIIETAAHYFPSARTLQGVWPLLAAAAAPMPLTNTLSRITLDEILKELPHHAGYGATLYLISDFHDIEERHLPWLYGLGEKFEVRALRIIDPAELSMPRAGKLRMISPVSGNSIVVDTDDPDIRRHYSDEMSLHTARLRHIFASAGIHSMDIHTDQDTFQQLNRLS